MKYFVSLVRPVFERAVVEVEAGSYSDAQVKALEAAAGLPDSSWRGDYKPSQYAFHIERTADADDAPEWVRAPDLTDMCYALLQADVDSGEGSLMPQPWMAEQSSLLLADVSEDWAGDIEAFGAGEVAAFQGELEKIWRDSGKNRKVVSFAHYLLMRRLEELEEDD